MGLVGVLAELVVWCVLDIILGYMQNDTKT